MRVSRAFWEAVRRKRCFVPRAAFGRRGLHLVLCALAHVPLAYGTGAGSSGQQPNTDPIGSMEAGLDLIFMHDGRPHAVPRKAASDFSQDGDARPVECDDGEHRCFVPEQQADLCPIIFAETKRCKCSESLRFLAAAQYDYSRHADYYLADTVMTLAWKFVRILPPEAYRIVYEQRASTSSMRRYAAVPDALLLVDSWPSLDGKSLQALKADGLHRTTWRLVLYPMAWRFFRLQMHEPLLRPGVLQPLVRGFIISPDVFSALLRKLDVAWCEGATPKQWCNRLRELLYTRHSFAQVGLPHRIKELVAKEATYYVAKDPSGWQVECKREGGGKLEPWPMELLPLGSMRGYGHGEEAFHACSRDIARFISEHYESVEYVEHEDNYDGYCDSDGSLVPTESSFNFRAYQDVRSAWYRAIRACVGDRPFDNTRLDECIIAHPHPTDSSSPWITVLEKYGMYGPLGAAPMPRYDPSGGRYNDYDFMLGCGCV
jgi:hypothetical protein